MTASPGGVPDMEHHGGRGWLPGRWAAPRGALPLPRLGRGAWAVLLGVGGSSWRGLRGLLLPLSPSSGAPSPLGAASKGLSRGPPRRGGCSGKAQASSGNPHRGLPRGPPSAFLALPQRFPSAGPSRGLAKAAGRRTTRDIKEADDTAPIFQYVGGQAKRKDRVFVWGFCDSGALGIPSFIVPDAGWKQRRRIQPTPYHLDVEEKISSAACGYGFTLLSSRTTDLTKVWGMGLNKDSQIGFHQSRRDWAKGYEYVLEPGPVPLPLDKPQQTRVLQVSCGRAHSLVLTDAEGGPIINSTHGCVEILQPGDPADNTSSLNVYIMAKWREVGQQQVSKGEISFYPEPVFSMGNNSYGQCGRKVIEGEIYSESQLINRLQGFEDRVVQVACGQDHSLFRTERGDVYSCGWGADGQTGLGHYDIASAPTKVGGDIAGVRITQVTSYGDCCLAVSEDGDLFGWGNSEYLQLASVTDSTQVNAPRHLPFKVGRVKEVSCGGTVNALLNEEGQVFVWGYGILGKGPKLMETASPEMIPPTLFGSSDLNPDICVARIRCGLSQFAAISNRGELFVWGKNVRGCLGIGRMEDQYFPWRVTVPGEVVDVACGVDHMVALVKSFV